MVCINCGNKNQRELGWIIVLEPNRILAKHGFTQMYALCIKCQNETIETDSLNALRESPRKVENQEARKKLYERNRTLCAKCNTPRGVGHWVLIFIAPSLYVKCTAYVHAKCANEIQSELKIIRPKEQMSIESTLLGHIEKPEGSS